MSITRKRAGRKAWETRRRFNDNVVDFFAALGRKEWKFDAATTSKMVIERRAKATGEIALITFSQAYSELFDWLGKSFADISDNGFSDMLAETFFQGAVIHTLKAEYRLWFESEPARSARSSGEMISLSNRKKEFFEAVKRGENSNLEVFEAWDMDSFVVVNRDNKNEYRVNLKHVDEMILADCECADFTFRGRVCKHIGAVLVDRLFGLSTGK